MPALVFKKSDEPFDGSGLLKLWGCRDTISAVSKLVPTSLAFTSRKWIRYQGTDTRAYCLYSLDLLVLDLRNLLITPNKFYFSRNVGSEI